MSRHDKGITIHDVAQAAGVSVSTVSRVLNDKDDVSPETYQRVQQVVAELGYASSLAARSMRSHRTGVIGLIIPDLEVPFCIQVLRGINRAIVELDRDLLAFTSGSPNQTSKATREQRHVALLNGSLADGVIVVTPSAADFSAAAPIVVIDPNADSTEGLSVIAANYAGALEATNYIIGLGHRRIGFIGGRADLRSARQRQHGYTCALEEAGLPIDPDLIAAGDFSKESGRACARQLLALSDPPTAIFAANDQAAFGAIEAAHDAGRRVPEDLSVIGFDNTPEAAYFHPALTTVDQFIVEMGHVATEMLVRVVQGEPVENPHYEMPTRLVIRNSCRPPANRA